MMLIGRKVMVLKEKTEAGHELRNKKKENVASNLERRKK